MISCARDKSDAAIIPDKADCDRNVDSKNHNLSKLKEVPVRNSRFL